MTIMLHSGRIAFVPLYMHACTCVYPLEGTSYNLDKTADNYQGVESII